MADALMVRKALFGATGKRYLVVDAVGPVRDRLRKACGVPVNMAGL
jgi:hypothetical protein